MKNNNVTQDTQDTPLNILKDTLLRKQEGLALEKCMKLFSEGKKSKDKTVISDEEMLELFKLAIENKCENVVKLLCGTKKSAKGIKNAFVTVDKDTKISQKTAVGFRIKKCLYNAIKCGSLNAVIYLTSKEFKKYSKGFDAIEKEGYTILGWAALHKQSNIAQYLVKEKKYSTKHTQSEGKITTLDNQELKCSDISPIVIAINGGDIDTIKGFLEINSLKEWAGKDTITLNCFYIPAFVQKHVQAFGGINNIASTQNHEMPLSYLAYSKGEGVFNILNDHCNRELMNQKWAITVTFKEKIQNQNFPSQYITGVDYGFLDIYKNNSFTTLHEIIAQGQNPSFVKMEEHKIQVVKCALKTTGTMRSCEINLLDLLNKKNNPIIENNNNNNNVTQENNNNNNIEPNNNNFIRNIIISKSPSIHNNNVIKNNNLDTSEKYPTLKALLNKYHETYIKGGKPEDFYDNVLKIKTNSEETWEEGLAGKDSMLYLNQIAINIGKVTNVGQFVAYGQLFPIFQCLQNTKHQHSNSK